MEHNKIYSALAIFVILLIIDLPIYTSAAVSGILNYRVYGQDGISNTVRRDDQLRIVANVSIPGDDNITSDQVWLGALTQFDDCVKTPNAFSCYLTYPSYDTKSFRDKEQYIIVLHYNNHTVPPTAYSVADSKSGYVAVDEYPPRIVLALDKTKTNSMLNVNYKAYDDSYMPGSYEICSGLKALRLYTEDRRIDKQFNFPKQNNCSFEGNFSVNTTSWPEGIYTLAGEASDYLAHTANYSVNFEVDRTAARFSNLSVVDASGREINYIGSNFIPATVTVNVNKDSNIANIRADLSALNDKTNYKDLLGECTLEDNTAKCQWQINIAPTAYGSKSLIFKGGDNIGNYGQQTLSKLLQRDIEGPRGITLTTSVMGTNGAAYLRRTNNTIEVTFAESGSGLDKENVFLDLSSLGGSSKLKPSSCQQGWKCTWQNLSFSSADDKYTVSVHPDTADRLGNGLKDTFSKELTVDTSAPNPLYYEIKTIRSGINKVEGITIIGDSIQVIARLYEPGQLSDAYADFSSIIKNAHLVQADECTQVDTVTWECKWISQAIDISGAINADLKFTFKDFLGNSAESHKTIQVYNLDTKYTDHFTHNVICSPPYIDRQVSNLIEQKIYCHVNLAGDAKVLSMELKDCTGNSTQYIKKTKLLNSQRTSTDPYIQVTLNTASSFPDKFEISCPLVIMSKFGTTVTSVPEIENIDISLGFTETTFSDYTSSLKDKINEAVKDAKDDFWEIITTLQNVIHYAERICSLITTINNIASFFEMVGYMTRLGGEKLMATPATAPAGLHAQALGAGQQSITQHLNNVISRNWVGGWLGGGVDKFCKFLSCRLFYDEWWSTGDKSPQDRANSGDVMGGVGVWQRTILEYANTVATGGPAGKFVGFDQQGVQAYSYQYQEPAKGKDKTSNEMGGVSAAKVLQGGKLNPKDSIVLSFLTLCIPGIIYNLDKIRQIDCMYADCLRTSAYTGVPVYACEDAKDYETCKYFYGEIFQLMPFTGLFNYAINLVKNILYNPFGIVDLALGIVCSQPYVPGAASLVHLCLFQQIAGVIADVWQDIANFEDNWKIKTDYCDRIDDIKGKSDDND
jgi:hypothetical protein